MCMPVAAAALSGRLHSRASAAQLIAMLAYVGHRIVTRTSCNVQTHALGALHACAKHRCARRSRALMHLQHACDLPLFY